MRGWQGEGLVMRCDSKRVRVDDCSESELVDVKDLLEATG